MNEFANAPLIFAGCHLSYEGQIFWGKPTADHLESKLRQLIGEDFGFFERDPEGFSVNAPFDLGNPLRLQQPSTGVSIMVFPSNLFVGWGKSAPPGVKYPGFKHLEKLLWSVHNVLVGHFGAEHKNVRQVGLTYADLIVEESLFGAQVLEKYFNESLRFPLLKSSSELEKLDVGWVQDGIDYRLKFHPSPVSVPGADFPVSTYVLNWSASGFPKPEDNAEETLEDIHAIINDLFVKVLSDHSKKEWGLK